ncbi:MAG: orotidine 5'-phosphate decarboxylase / HUMPS family protein [Porticoccaceae bacterium]
MSDKPTDRRAFLNRAGGFAMGALAAGPILGLMQPRTAEAQQATNLSHPASARVLDQLKTSYTFQISVDVSTIEEGLYVAEAALAGGVDILEMGTPLLKKAGVSNVVPAFRQAFPDALLLADMKTMDGGGGEARAVYEGGANIIDFLSLSGTDSARAVCAVRDEFRQEYPEIPRLAFADIFLPHQGPVSHVIEVALSMIDAGVDGVGVHLQTDARRANPELMGDYLPEIASTVFEHVGNTAAVQIVGGLSLENAKLAARGGLRAFVISGNLGQSDGQRRYDLPQQQIEDYIADFIDEVSSV